MWSGGGYLAVDKSVGSLIDWVSRLDPIDLSYLSWVLVDHHSSTTFK